jgi:hypothetical protein
MASRWTAGQDPTPGQLNAYYGDADTNNVTVTQATFTTVSGSYTIPANEAAANSAYELLTGGSGVWGSTQQALSFQITLAGTVLFANTTIANTAFAASAAFRWSARALIVCNAAGATGTWTGDLLGCLTQIANNINPGTAANNTVPFADSNTGAVITQDTTVAIAVVLQAKWNATTGAPTISGRHTCFRKIA